MIYPDSIISTTWTDYRCQEIHFEHQGKVYVIIGENLLRDIAEFAYNEGWNTIGLVRVNGFESYEYYPKPSDLLLKHYIVSNYKFLNIYTQDGETIEEGK